MVIVAVTVVAAVAVEMVGVWVDRWRMMESGLKGVDGRGSPNGRAWERCGEKGAKKEERKCVRSDRGLNEGKGGGRGGEEGRKDCDTGTG